MQLLFLDDHRDGFVSLQLQVEQRLAAGEDVANLSFTRLEGTRLIPAAVDNAGDYPLSPHAARVARSKIRTGGSVQRFASASHRTGEDRERAENGTCDTLSPVADESKIPKGRLRRSAKLGSIVGMQGARYAGTKATNVARSEEDGKERLEQRHIETAMKMVGALGQMKGAAMKLGQFASFIDTEFIPDEYREIYQEQLAKLRTDAPAMPWEKVEKVLEEEYEGEPLSELFAEFEREAFAAASIGQVHRAELLDGRAVAVKIQYPGIAEALDADLRNAGTIVRLARALAPGLDAKEIANELRERVMEELDYEYEAQNQRSFARAYRDHPFIYVPEVITRISRRRVLVTELVEGVGFEQVKELPHEERSRFGEIVFRGSFGSIYHLQHFNADPHPGNYILMADSRVAFLDFGMTKKLDHEQIVLEQRAIDAAFHEDPERLRQAFHELGFVKNPSKLDAERLMEHTMAVSGWFIEDREIEISARRVMKIIESTNDPRSEYYDLMRRESLPADELMGRRMEIGVVAVLGQLRAKRNWHRIMREWIYADPPATALGEEEWEYFEGRGSTQTPIVEKSLEGEQR
jgi:predicted unusual protein kinase regulating ubiquinone biosynthesis (AarF/ABC1/UbiB family)